MHTGRAWEGENAAKLLTPPKTPNTLQDPSPWDAQASPPQHNAGVPSFLCLNPRKKGNAPLPLQGLRVEGGGGLCPPPQLPLSLCRQELSAAT